MAKPSAETIEEPFSTGENFAEMLEESFRIREPIEGAVLKGSVIAIENDMAVIDVGLKSVGRVSLREFAPHDEEANVQIGDEVDVYLERYENRHGDAVLSREKARREEAWTLLEKAFKETTRVEGVISVTVFVAFQAHAHLEKLW